jgi:hypothetical protein
MSLLKKGVRFISQDTNTPMTLNEIPFIFQELTPKAIQNAALFGLTWMMRQGMTLNQALDLLDDKPKEKH